MSRDDSFRNLRHASDVVASVLHEIATDGATDAEVLKTHPGKGMSNLELGLPRLMNYAAEGLGIMGSGLDRVQQLVREQYVKGQELCESPIERSMLAALLTAGWAGFNAAPAIVHDTRKQTNELLPPGEIVIVPQMAFVRYRLDFGVVIVKDGRWKLYDVECDGKEFHQDAVKEFDRTAYLASWGVKTLRVTGAAIFEDAILEADRIVTAIGLDYS